MKYKNISTIIFDAGGVLLYINRRRKDITRSLLLSMGYSLESIENAIKAGEDFDKEYFIYHNNIHDWNEEKRWLTKHYSAVAGILDTDNKFLAEKLFMLTFDTYEYMLYPEVIEVLENLKGKYKLGILSNALPSLDWAFDHLQIRKYFNSVIISSYEGIEKPNEKIYKTAVEKLGSHFEECLFIDDRIENVEVAGRLGINVFHLNRKKETLNALQELLEDEFTVA